jgi:tRNA(Leu) C34 or U34 (ribose-2'-O)-methylase TrmL
MDEIDPGMFDSDDQRWVVINRVLQEAIIRQDEKALDLLMTHQAMHQFQSYAEDLNLMHYDKAEDVAFRRVIDQLPENIRQPLEEADRVGNLSNVTEMLWFESLKRSKVVGFDFVEVLPNAIERPLDVPTANIAL